MASVFIVFALITVLIYGAAVWTDRQKLEVISSDSEVNLNYGRAKKNVWKNTWIACAWLHTVYVAALVWAMQPERMHADLLIWGCMAVTIVTLAFMLLAGSRINRIERAYADRKDLMMESADDDNWIGGILYYNQNDRHVMVNKREGIGTTMNMATPAGMGITVFSVLVLALIPVMCVWIIAEEFTPTRLHVQEGILAAEHLKTEYEIPLSEISGAELTGELPRMSKVVGTGMDTLCKGTFHIRNEGDCEMFLNPQNDIFIRFEADGVVYYMSGTDDNETREVYELISNEQT